MIREMVRVSIVVLGGAWILPGAPGGYVPFDALVEKADAIIAGTIVFGNMSTPEFSVSLSVDSVFKGPGVGSLINVRGNLPAMVRAQGPVLLRDRGLWFVQLGRASGEWVALALQSPDGVRSNYYWLPRGISYQGGSSSGKLTDRLIAIIAESIAKNDRDDEDAIRLLRSTRSLHSPEIDAVFERLLQEQGARAKVLGAARLLRQSRREALLATEKLLSGPLGQYDATALVDGLYDFRASDADSVAALGRLAVSASSRLPSFGPFIERASGFSLGRIHNRYTLPYLGALLDSKDALLREEAVAGLSLFTAEIPVVSEDRTTQLAGEYLRSRLEGNVQLTLPFESQQTIRHFHRGAFEDADREREIVEFWRSWWNANKGALAVK